MVRDFVTCLWQKPVCTIMEPIFRPLFEALLGREPWQQGTRLCSCPGSQRLGNKALALWATTATLSPASSQAGRVQMNIRSSFGKRADVATRLHFFLFKNTFELKGWSWKTLIFSDHAWKTAQGRSYWIHMWNGRKWARFFVSWFGYYSSPPGRAHHRQGCRLYSNLPVHVHGAERGALVEQPSHRRLWVFITEPAIAPHAPHSPLRTAQWKSRICSPCTQVPR